MAVSYNTYTSCLCSVVAGRTVDVSVAGWFFFLMYGPKGSYPQNRDLAGRLSCVGTSSSSSSSSKLRALAVPQEQDARLRSPQTKFSHNPTQHQVAVSIRWASFFLVPLQ